MAFEPTLDILKRPAADFSGTRKLTGMPRMAEELSWNAIIELPLTGSMVDLTI